ncbi:MAG: alpha/beta hydrolase [Clostridia bacterium]|nr:alpha/beta hydrolase [Clostridia bacterium]
MPSLAALFMRLQLHLTKPIVRFAGIPAARLAQDQLGRLTVRALKERVTYEDCAFETFSASFASPKTLVSQDAVILYLHGGGYTAGGLDYCKAFGGVLAEACGLKTFCVAYRLAPEHRYPAALDDALEAYGRLLAMGWPAERIVVAGESAGGGLSFCLGLRLKSEGRPLPAGFVGISPWADLTFQGASYHNNVRRDPSLCRESLAFYVIMYAAGHEDEPFVSQVLGEFSGFQPSLLYAGGDEILLDDARTLAVRLQAAGAQAELIVENGLWHVYPLYGLPESRRAIRRMAEFIQERLAV